MLIKKRSLAAWALTLSFLSAPACIEAADLTAVRYHSGTAHDRLVFDWSEMPRYNVSLSADKRVLTLDFSDAVKRYVSKEAISGSRVESVDYKVKDGHLLVSIRLRPGLTYKLGKLAAPDRIFVDVMPQQSAVRKPVIPAKPATGTKPARADMKDMMPLDFDGLYTEMMAPGVAKREYVYWDDAGKISAYFVEADKDLYKVKPVLAKGRVPGLQTTSGMSDMTDAVAAVNATYFAGNGDAIGMIKIDGDMAGTTYYRRTALGINSYGQPFMGPVSYEGSVLLGSVSMPVSGVDCERGANNVTIYNHWYGSRTRTNEYGKEYTVVNGTVTAISDGNSPIPADGWVVSVHGTAAEAFAGVQVGDRGEITQELGARWDKAPDIMGAGPRLVQNGQVCVTAGEEQFPGDIRYGRAPRSAVAILKNGNYLFGVVDGRQSNSRGLTLTDWAKLLVKMGAKDAMNLDGGGSSALVIGGQVQNSPSDGSERYVGSALILTKK
ncbi:Predicted protein [Selenomonas ruminantium]|uniref:Phosphodiester glycosidase domain-containing protein n=1 Tax=Selenomonas ruminantium TaxID=971 RepID=A0A1M6TBE7_SELRU|nr:phosphodiester glycosidase family protein [Selenomonas ruminantium]SHK54290.1 Predicted protein [Selenomonas ruminantium]